MLLHCVFTDVLGSLGTITSTLTQRGISVPRAAVLATTSTRPMHACILVCRLTCVARAWHVQVLRAVVFTTQRGVAIDTFQLSLFDRETAALVKDRTGATHSSQLIACGVHADEAALVWTSAAAHRDAPARRGHSVRSAAPLTLPPRARVWCVQDRLSAQLAAERLALGHDVRSSLPLTLSALSSNAVTFTISLRSLLGSLVGGSYKENLSIGDGWLAYGRHRSRHTRRPQLPVHSVHGSQCVPCTVRPTDMAAHRVIAAGRHRIAASEFHSVTPDLSDPCTPEPRTHSLTAC